MAAKKKRAGKAKQPGVNVRMAHAEVAEIDRLAAASGIPKDDRSKWARRALDLYVRVCGPEGSAVLDRLRASLAESLGMPADVSDATVIMVGLTRLDRMVRSGVLDPWTYAEPEDVAEVETGSE